MAQSSLYIQDSLELNLFFLRIMKEHALFLQLGFMPKDKPLATEAENLRIRLDELMRQTIQLAKGYVSGTVMSSGELFTRYTQEAERQTQYFTGIPIDIQLTEEEYNVGGTLMPPVTMQIGADQLNQNAIRLTQELLRFKERIRKDVLACNIITKNYPLMIDHLIREASHYIMMLETLIARDLTLGPHELAEEESFWNNIMREHVEFIDGQLDPTEKALKNQARALSVQFERLMRQAEVARGRTQTLTDVTMRSKNATENIRNYKDQGTNGILSCKIRSIIIPLLSDHVLREANHYLRVLNETMG
ncbi:MAG: DUF2935 domain-containing protein [Christensenellales bacterium]